MTAVSITGLARTFGEAVAVRDFSLDIAKGEFVALLGPSGCGKTTIMRMIAGITKPDHGTIHINGRRVDQLPPEKRNVGLVFQSYALFPHMSVGANVGFGLEMRGVARPEIRRRVAAALEMVDLGALADRAPRALSGGQQQRVALARALVTEPDILLLDEPMSNLDARLRDQLRENIRALQQRLGITAIYVTHDQSEALAIADTVVVMRKGEMIEKGSPRDLYHRPTHAFTAQFLGDTNLIPANAGPDGLTFRWGETRPAAGLPGGGMRFAVRPEDIGLIGDAQGPARIDEVTFLGSEVEYRLTLAGETLRVRASGQQAPKLVPGDHASIRLPATLHPIQDEVAA